MEMNLRAVKTDLETVRPFRTLFLREANFQFIHNAFHVRGWSDVYLLTVDDRSVGYGALQGMEDRAARDCIFEFYVIPSFRSLASRLFPVFVAASEARFIECQSNDLLLTAMLYEFAKNINAGRILFEDHAVTHYGIPGAVLRPVGEGIQSAEHIPHGSVDYLLELNGEEVGNGCILFHYNLPFADLAMEVKEEFRQKGFGSFILQELKKECYLAHRVPAARCNVQNKASKATLLKAGLNVCGFELLGQLDG